MAVTSVLKPCLFCALFLVTMWIPGLYAQYAEIEFDKFYTLVFPRNRMRNFQECMCVDDVSACILDYNRHRGLGEYFYEAVRTVEETQSSDVYGNITFLCSPGDFIRSDKLVCIRLKDSYERCTMQENCLLTHVDFFQKGCDSKCINVAWSGYSVSFRNFSQNLMFQDGTCWDPSPRNDSIISASTSTEPVLSPSTAETAPYNSNNNDDKDNDTEIIVAAVGWGLLAIIIIIAIISLLIFRKKFRLTKKRQIPSMQNSRVVQNNYTPSNANGLSPQGSYLTPSPAPQAYESPRASAIDGETAEYMDLEDEYMVIEDERLDVTKQSIKVGRNGAVPVLNGHAPQVADKGHGDGNQTRSEYVMAGDTEFPSSDTTHQSTLSVNQTPDDAEDDGGYNSFESSRSRREPGVTDSFLETYNTSTHSAEAEDGIDQGGEFGGATQKKMDGESEDPEMCRDSKGYTTAMKVSSVKAKDSSLKTKNSSPTFQTKDMDEDKASDCINESDRGVTFDQSDSLSSNPADPYDMAHPISA